jgi:hypothetical protein
LTTIQSPIIRRDAPAPIIIDTQEKAEAHGVGGAFRHASATPVLIYLACPEDRNPDSLPYEPPPCPKCGGVYVEVIARTDFEGHLLLCCSGHEVDANACSLFSWASCEGRIATDGKGLGTEGGALVDPVEWMRGLSLGGRARP